MALRRFLWRLWQDAVRKKILRQGPPGKLLQLPTSLERLTIGEGAVIKAPEGKSLTMTVDGVETGTDPGTYKGNIVLNDKK